MPFRHARHTRAVWQCRHAMALSGPLATHPGTSRDRLPPASPPRCDGTEAKVSHLHSINKRLTAHRRCDAPSGPAPAERLVGVLHIRILGHNQRVHFRPGGCNGSIRRGAVPARIGDRVVAQRRFDGACIGHPCGASLMLEDGDKAFRPRLCDGPTRGGLWVGGAHGSCSPCASRSPVVWG